ncbi:MAG: hypothetical protein QNK20_06635 [Aureibaculum sp.]|nr:hypothetical protein [Aureibaculum sp.]
MSIYKMKVLGVLIIVVFITLSCKQKSVQLPTLDVVGIQDTIYNNSKIWMFYTRDNNDTIAEVNKNNSVANTHWIFNIDKRLSLKQVIPFIHELQTKKEKPSMHDNGEITHSYLSYVDTISNKLSLILFDSIEYVNDKSINRDSILKQDQFKHLFIDCNTNDFFVNNVFVEKEEINDFITKQLDTCLLQINLSFDKNLSYQNYIHLKAILENIKNDSISIANREYIY